MRKNSIKQHLPAKVCGDVTIKSLQKLRIILCGFQDDVRHENMNLVEVKQLHDDRTTRLSRLPTDPASCFYRC